MNSPHWKPLLFLFFWFQSMAVAQPNAPGNFYATATKISASSARINFYWVDQSNNETSWQIGYREAGQTSFGALAAPFSTTASLGTGSIVTLQWNFGQLSKNYEFIVFAINGLGSRASNIAPVNTFDLNAPFNLTVGAADPFNVSMFWDEASTTEDGFSLERKIGTGPWTILSPTNAANDLDIGVSQLTQPSTTYSFRVRAFRGGAPTAPDSSAGASQVSPYSNEATITSLAYPLTATPVAGQTQINLSWPDVANDAGYQVFMQSPGTSDFQLVVTTNTSTRTFQATNSLLEAGKTYSFIVRPVFISSSTGASTIATTTVDGITSSPGAAGVPGSSFSHTFTHGSIASVTSRSLSGVPSGLTFLPSTGVLSGTCPAVGLYPMTFTMPLSNGATLTQTFTLRVRPMAGAPLVGTAIPSWNSTAGTQRVATLAGTFTDAEAESAVRVNTTLGAMDFILFNTATPATVANFMNYANANRYNGVAFHRSVPGFVVQSGGFKGTGTGSQFASVVTFPTVSNEPGLSNLRGTIAMAKVGGNPNSATSQFFVNTSDTNAPNLDTQNGGFTVFGRVAGTGMSVADAINALPRATYPLFLNGSTTATSFPDLPMNAATAPTVMDQTKVVNILSVTTIPTLSYSITGNTQPLIASASITNGELRITGLRGGRTTVTVTATDLDNLSTSQEITVTINDTFATWSGLQTFPNGQNGLLQDSDNDGANNLFEYAFFGDPAIANQSLMPTLGSTVSSPSSRALTIQFPVRKFTAGLNYLVQANDLLTGNWTDIWSSAQGFAHPQVVDTLDQSDRTMVRIMDTITISARSTRFLRVTVTQQ
jgi:cyclophilin family peptidyl-prolyl cis-trans isomerase